MKCGDCRFYQQVDIRAGACHFNPPQVATLMQQDRPLAPGLPMGVRMELKPYWTPVQSDWWCGRFQPKEPEILSVD